MEPKAVEPMTNAECAAAYRRLADLLEANPDMPQPYEGSQSARLLLFAENKDGFRAAIRAFGRGKKDHDDDMLIFEPDFPLNIRVYGFKNKCCEAVTTTRVVPEKVIPAQPAKDAEVIPAHEETVTEYACAPFLAVPEAV